MKRTTVFPILLFCIAAFIAGVEQAEAQGSVDTDREALVALYDATKGDDWNDNTNWKSDKPLNNILTGSIPSELGDLVNLEELFKITPNIVVDFHNNSFSQKEIELKPGGVNYIAYENASNLHFAIDTSNKQLTLLRLFKEKGNTKELVDIDRNVDEYMVSGDYDRITLIAVHANPRLDQADIALTISATQNYGVATEDQELPTAFSLE